LFVRQLLDIVHVSAPIPVDTFSVSAISRSLYNQVRILLTWTFGETFYDMLTISSSVYCGARYFYMV